MIVILDINDWRLVSIEVAIGLQNSHQLGVEVSLGGILHDRSIRFEPAATRPCFVSSDDGIVAPSVFKHQQWPGSLVAVGPNTNCIHQGGGTLSNVSRLVIA